MTKRMIIMLIAVALVLGGIFGYKVFTGIMMKKYMAAAGAPAQTVSTTKASTQDWQPKLEAVGSLRALNGADLSAEVSGIVESIKFESGTDVKAGAVLVQLRAEDDTAHLLSLQAAERLAEITYARDLKQIQVQAISQATVDTDAANMTGLRAQVAEQQAVLDKKTIRAPFAGHLGIRLVDIGQYLNPGTAIVTLQQLDPIYIDFTLPEEALTQIKLGQTMTLTSDALVGKSFEGEISSINSKVDESTRNISVRATLQNPDHVLLPGMFGRVVIATGEPQSYVTLPQTAITYNPYGDTVYIVESASAAAGKDNAQQDDAADAADDEKDGSKEKKADKHQKADDGKSTDLIAHQTFVKIGPTRGDQVAILSGVKEGDVVVTAGQIKLRNGVSVVINNQVTPTDNPNPAPQDQ